MTWIEASTESGVSYEQVVGRPTRPLRWLWLTAGLVCTGLAVIGALLPVMPSTVFALAAAGCFARSSPKLEHWLLRQPSLGPAIVAWRAEGAIPVSAKRLALSSMALSAAVVAMTAPLPVAAVSAALLLASSLYVGTRPHPMGA